MTPTIRVDDQVYAWLQSQARPFEDTPNSVLRRIASLNEQSAKSDSPKKRKTSHANSGTEKKTPQNEFRIPILRVLKKHNGEAPRIKVLQDLEVVMADNLTEFDKMDIDSGSIRWQKSAEWEVRIMREDGLLKPVADAPRGIWALTQKGWNVAK